MAEESALPERESMEFDVVIVGAGPAGLAAAIRLKQLANEAGRELSVVVLEKGSEVGAHILSGAVIDPAGISALFPDWRERGAPITQEVTEDRFLYLGPAGRMRIPNFVMPPLMSNHGNYVVSLEDVVRWLNEQAVELGVDVYPGFPAAELVKNAEGAVIGVATGDMGVGRDGEPKDSFTRGMELRGKYVLIAEGAHGSLAKQLIREFNLREGRDPQKYGIGLKELWQVKPERHRPGLVQHTLGWPLDNATGGGSFMYHYGDNLVAVGFVVHLNYANPIHRAFRGIPALQDASLDSPGVRGRQAPRLRRAGNYRGRLAIHPEAHLSGRCADRLCRWHGQPAPHQGLAQCHSFRQACRGSRICRDRGGAGERPPHRL